MESVIIKRLHFVSVELKQRVFSNQRGEKDGPRPRGTVSKFNNTLPLSQPTVGGKKAAVSTIALENLRQHTSPFAHANNVLDS